MTKIKINYYNKIVWCGSHNVEDQVVGFFKHDRIYNIDLNLINIPRVNEYILFNGSERTVKRIVYAIFDDKKHDDFDIFIETHPDIIKVNYYKYMKRFTHCLDYLKSDSDPSKMDLGYVKFIPPETEAEWYEDIKLLEKDITNLQSLVDLSMRRCAIVEK